MVEIVVLLKQDHIEIDNSNAQVEKVQKCQRNMNYCRKTYIKIDKRDEIFLQSQRNVIYCRRGYIKWLVIGLHHDSNVKKE